MCFLFLYIFDDESNDESDIEFDIEFDIEIGFDSESNEFLVTDIFNIFNIFNILSYSIISFLFETIKIKIKIVKIYLFKFD